MKEIFGDNKIMSLLLEVMNPGIYVARKAKEHMTQGRTLAMCLLPFRSASL